MSGDQSQTTKRDDWAERFASHKIRPWRLVLAGVLAIASVNWVWFWFSFEPTLLIANMALIPATTLAGIAGLLIGRELIGPVS